ncbi:MAG: DUF3499 family protein [Acidimicrobiales bacterium]
MREAMLCAKPGCQGATVAWLTYDYSGRRIWLDAAPIAGGDQWGLCSGHADRLSAPVGWARVDRRTPGPDRPADQTGEAVSPAAS